MARLAIFAAAVMMLVFSSPAAAQNTGSGEATTPEDAGGAQYDQYGGEQTTQAIEEGIEDAVDHAEENNSAADGTEAYINELAPDEAEAAEPAEQPMPSASEKYENLPDTGGPSLALAALGAMLVAGGAVLRKSQPRGR